VTPGLAGILEYLLPILEGPREKFREGIRANLAKFDQEFFAKLAELIGQIREEGNQAAADSLEQLPALISQSRIEKGRALECQAMSDALARGEERLEGQEWREARHEAEKALKLSLQIDDRRSRVSARLMLARVAISSKDRDLAIAHYSKAAEEARANGFWEMEDLAVLRAGDLLRENGDKNNARVLLERYLEIHAKLRWGKSRAYGRLALAYTYVDDDASLAKRYFGEALAESVEGQDLHVIANAALNLGHLYLLEGDANTARTFLVQARGAFEQQNAPQGVAIVESLLPQCEGPGGSTERNQFSRLQAEGLEAFERGEIDRAENAWRRAAANTHATGNHTGEATALSNIAKLYRDRRQDAAGALALFEEALRAARQAGAADLQAAILNSMGRVHRSLGQRSEAKQAYTNAAGAARLCDDYSLHGNILINLGNEYKLDRNLWTARDHYQRALRLGEQANDAELRIVALGNLGNVEEAWQDFAKAEAYYRQGLQQAEKIGYKQGIANQAGNLASVSSWRGDAQQALFFLEKALRTADEMNDPELKLAATLNFAGGLSAGGRYEEALEHLNRAAQLDSAMVRPDIVDSIYVQRAELHAQMRNDAAAADDWKTLNQRVESRCEHEFEVRRDIRAYEPFVRTATERLSHTLGLSNPNLLVEQLEALRAKPFCKINSKSPLDAPTMRELLESRDERTALIHFLVLRDRVLVVGRQKGWDSPMVKTVNLTTEDLKDSNKRRLQELDHYPDQPDLEETWFEVIQELSDAIAEVAAGSEAAYLCPDSLLWYLPLHAARVDGEPLLKHFSMVYIDCASRLAHLWEKPSQPLRNCLAAGVGLTAGDDPLFQGEAKIVAKLFGEEALVAERVTRQRILSGMPGKDVIHLSTHGKWGFESTALVLRDESETLLASEVERLDLSARLVFLSGCDSAWLDPTALFVGMNGFPNAFLEAGASSVIAGSWPVSAAASLQIVNAFYQRLQRPGMTAAKALQQAQLEIREKAYYKGHTYYWAPFSLVGDGR
jgi:CHAT domain-containing protein